MADYSMYHALGQGGAFDEDSLKQQTPPSPNAQFSPSAAPPPPGLQHAGTLYGTTPSNLHSEYRPSPLSDFSPIPDAGHHALSPSTPNAADSNEMAGLASQMGGLGITADAGARGHRKKHRHAHHDIGGPAASSQVSNGVSYGGQQASSQFLNTRLNQQQQAAAPVAAHPALGGGSGMSISPQPDFPGPKSGSVPTHGKIDPEQIPSIPRSRDIPAQYYFNHVYPTLERHLPPPAAIPFVAHDQGNSSPKYARLTLNNIPSTSDFLSSTALPLGLILQPLARLDPGEQPIPVIDFGETGPPRCRRCRTYINPFMVFRAGGNKFVCNMCTFPNEVSPEYYAPLDPSGARVDRMQRPELLMGTVEFIVPREYWVKEPVGLRWLFLIDVSQESINRGFLEGVCEGIVDALYGSESDASEENNSEMASRKLPEASKVGIITFDKEVHFYNLSVCLFFPFLLSGIWFTHGYIASSGPSSNDGDDGFGGAFRSTRRRAFRRSL
jgi:protein transport protein SEC24